MNVLWVVLGRNRSGQSGNNDGWALLVYRVARHYHRRSYSSLLRPTMRTEVHPVNFATSGEARIAARIHTLFRGKSFVTSSKITLRDVQRLFRHLPRPFSNQLLLKDVIAKDFNDDFDNRFARG